MTNVHSFRLLVDVRLDVEDDGAPLTAEEIETVRADIETGWTGAEIELGERVLYADPLSVTVA